MKILNQREVYEALAKLYIAVLALEVAKGRKSQIDANRMGNIMAVENTVKVWRDQYER